MNFLLRKDEAEKTYMKKEESYTKTEVDEILGNELDKYIVIQNIAPVEDDGKQRIILYVSQTSFATPKDSMKVGLLYQTNLTDTVNSILINDKTTISDADSVNIKHGVVNISSSSNVPLLIDVSASENHLLACKLYVQFNNEEGNTKTIYGPAYVYNYGVLLSQANRTIASTECYKNLNDKVSVAETKLSNKVDKVEGKNLSTNDFTDELKTKLEGIEEGANKTTTDTELNALSNNGIANSAVSEKFNSIDSKIANKADVENIYTKTEIDDKYFISGDLGTEILEDTDLNNITTPGAYYTKTSQIALSCSNKPYKDCVGFKMEVSYLWDNNAFKYLVQKLCTYTYDNFGTFIRIKGNLEKWSPWHLMNGNDFTNYAYASTNVNEKYVKVASCNISTFSGQSNNMLFDIYSNYNTRQSDINADKTGKLLCFGYTGANSKYNIGAIWLSKGTNIESTDWFVTYHNETIELWKKIRDSYESYNVILLGSSSGYYTNINVNTVTMYYSKNNEDTYDASLYEKVVTSTTCNSTSVTQLEFGNAIATNLIDTSKITSTTAYGVTRTVYPDGKVSFNGTSTLNSDYFLVLMASRPLTAGNYRFTPNGTAISGVVPTTYQLYKDNKYLKGINPSKVITIDTDGTYGIGAVIKSKATINTEFYPMLELGLDAHNYVRYTGDTGTLNGDLAALASKFNDPDWTSVSIGSDVTSGSLEYKQFNALTNVVGKNIQVLNAVKTVSIGSLSVNQRPRVTIRIPTDTINVFVIITTDGTISLQHTTGTLSTSASYTFSATYLK